MNIYVIIGRTVYLLALDIILPNAKMIHLSTLLTSPPYLILHPVEHWDLFIWSLPRLQSLFYVFQHLLLRDSSRSQWRLSAPDILQPTPSWDCANLEITSVYVAKELKSGTQTDFSTSIFIETLLTTAKDGSPPVYINNHGWCHVFSWGSI